MNPIEKAVDELESYLFQLLKNRIIFNEEEIEMRGIIKRECFATGVVKELRDAADGYRRDVNNWVGLVNSDRHFTTEEGLRLGEAVNKSHNELRAKLYAYDAMLAEIEDAS